MIRVKTKNARRLDPSAFVGEIRMTTLAITGAGEVVVRPGWLYCNGAAVSRATYKRLYDRIGTTFGVGDGSTTFNLPDYRGRILAGALDGQAAGGNRMTAAAGTTTGEELHALVIAEIPRHVHNTGTLNINGGSHTHSDAALTVSGNNAQGTTAGTARCAWTSGQTAYSSFVTGSSANATHTHPSGEIAGSTGNGSADTLAGTGHSNVPPVQGCAMMVAY